MAPACRPRVGDGRRGLYRTRGKEARRTMMGGMDREAWSALWMTRDELLRRWDEAVATPELVDVEAVALSADVSDEHPSDDAAGLV